MRINAGDTAWVLTSAALVLFMTPGLALFYGGMVRAKNVLAMLMQNFFCHGAHRRAVGRRACTRSRSAAPASGSGTSTSRSSTGANTTAADRLRRVPIPPLSFSAFQMMFAIITPALITGAIADRMKFSAWVWFIGLWALARVRAGRALGVLARGLAVPARARSTSPAAPSCTSTPGSRRSSPCS